jgi:hypothetical protein
VTIVLAGYVHHNSASSNSTNTSNQSGHHGNLSYATLEVEPQLGGGLYGYMSELVGGSDQSSKHTETVAVLMLSASVGAAGLCLSGFNVNHLDLAPKYAGVLMGITNTFATIPGFLAPQITDSITANAAAGSVELTHKWQSVFYIAAVAYVFGIGFYLIFASGEKQWWADGVPTGGRKAMAVN